MVSINNTDPMMVKFALYWIVKTLKVPKEKIRVQIHLYSDMDADAEVEYWSKLLNIQRSQFNKPYIKKSLKSDIDQKGFGHGTCGLIVGNTTLKENLLMAMKVVGDFYSHIKV